MELLHLLLAVFFASIAIAVQLGWQAVLAGIVLVTIVAVISAVAISLLRWIRKQTSSLEVGPNKKEQTK